MKIIVANWKMNPAHLVEAKALFSVLKKITARQTKNVEIVVCPPFIYLEELRKLSKSFKFHVSSFRIGGQNCFWENSGAYTGETSPLQLKNAGCEWVILGHSERRRHFSETDNVINKKVKAGLEAGLKVVLCAGEEERVGEFDLEARIVGGQLEGALDGVKKTQMRNVVIAYEPVWAIGTGVSDTSNQTLQAAIFIRKKIGEMFGRNIGQEQKVLYGGSVNSKNAKPFLQEDGIDGVLVGGASLNANEFLKIIDQAAILK